MSRETRNKYPKNKNLTGLNKFSQDGNIFTLVLENSVVILHGLVIVNFV